MGPSESGVSDGASARQAGSRGSPLFRFRSQEGGGSGGEGDGDDQEDGPAGRRRAGTLSLIAMDQSA